MATSRHVVADLGGAGAAPPADDPEQARALRLAFYGGLAGLGVASLALVNAVLLPSRLAVVPVPPRLWGVPFTFAVLYLGFTVALRRGHTLAGRVGLLAVASLHLVSFSLMVGIEPGTPFLALILLAAPSLFFTAAERRFKLCGLLMPIAAVLAIGVLTHERDPLIVVPVESLAIGRVVALALAALLVVLALESNNHLVRRAREELAAEQERSDALLRNILPEPVAERLKRGDRPLADEFEEVTVLFADIAGFTAYAAPRRPEAVVEVLNEIVSGFDRIAEQLGVEKIKTIGDAYMAVSGLPQRRDDHAGAAAAMALRMLDHLQTVASRRAEPLALRIGLHSGRVVAGVIGSSKFAYDLWGDTVNVASRLESSGVPGRIHVSAATRERLRDEYVFEECGHTPLKGRGSLATYFLVTRRDLDDGPQAGAPTAP